MIVLNHASNVTGTLLPVAEVGRLAKERGLLLLVDAAQTAGVLSIDMQNENIDLLAFTGHKGLLGPTGTGGLCVGPEVPVEQFRPLVQGGTGSNSELEEQPGFLPDKFESGTLNAAGLAGLDAGVRFLLDRGVAQIRKREMQLTRALLEGLSSTDGVTVYGPLDASLQTGTVAFNLSGIESSEVALRLDEVYGIMCRPGLHCAPAAHKTIGTYPGGTVRFSLGFFSTAGEVAEACAAVRALASEKQR
jgi:selenocysteine lyase/cysteine desulfurase